MSECLIDCLKEAQLEQYLPNFVRKGVRNCEHLVALSMPEYPKFGITLMDHRIRLFKLIQIVKSVQAEGIHCKHDDRGSVVKGTQAHGPPHKNNMVKSIGKVDVDTRRLPSVNTKPHPAAPEKPDHPISAHGLDPQFVAAQPPKAVPGRDPPKAKRSLFSQPKPQVEYKPGSDSPVFKCRKMLDFSDPGLYSDEEEEILPSMEPVINSPPQSIVMCDQDDFYGDLGAQPMSPTHVSNKQCNAPTLHQISNSGNYMESKPNGFLVDVEKPSALGNSEKMSHAVGPTSYRSVQAKNKSQLLGDSINPLDVPNITLPKDNLSVTRSENHKVAAKQAPLINSITKTPGSLTPSIDAVVYGGIMHSASAVSHMVPPRSLEHPDKHIHAAKEPVPFPKHAYFPQISPEEKPRVRHKERQHHAASRYNYGVPSTVEQVSEYPEAKEEANPADTITVCVRKRPFNIRESKRKERDIVEVTDITGVCVNEIRNSVDMCAVSQKHEFTYDRAFDEGASNEDVYSRCIKPLVSCVFDRGLAMCFAFGQTGAGKTYTLLGNKTTLGLYQLAAADMLGMLQSPQLRGLNLHLWVSYYEIYCGHLYDLLNKRKKLTVRENGKHKVCIAGLMETQVSSIKSLTEVVQYGCSCRRTGNTGVNPHSSRSHAILQLEVRDSREYKVGRLSFIDLAGSERASDATNHNRQTRKEGAEINQSLLALKECIRSMDQETKHTPYRQSKLTHILRESFTSKSRTVMIANVAPTQSACENTLNTLKYAQRVKELRRGEGSSLRPNRSKSNTPGQSKSSFSSPRKATLFHPSKIQYSSTPKHKQKETAKSLDLSRALAEAYESPVRGHTVERTRGRGGRSQGQSDTEADNGFEVAKLSPIGVEQDCGLVGRGEVVDLSSPTANKRNIVDSTHNADGIEDVRATTEAPVRTTARSDSSSGQNNVVTSEGGRVNVHRRSQSLPRQTSSGSSRESPRTTHHSSSRHSSNISPKSTHHSSNHSPRTTHHSTRSPRPGHRTSRKSSQSSVRSEVDIIQEHKEIMSQLDRVLDKAKTVMTTTGGELPRTTSLEEETLVKPAVVSRAADRKASIQSARQILTQMHNSGHSVPLKALNRLGSWEAEQPKVTSVPQGQGESTISHAPFKVSVKYNEHLPALLKRNHHSLLNESHNIQPSQSQLQAKKGRIASPDSPPSQCHGRTLAQSASEENMVRSNGNSLTRDETESATNLVVKGIEGSDEESQDSKSTAPHIAPRSRAMPIFVMKPEAMDKLQKQPITQLDDKDVATVVESSSSPTTPIDNDISSLHMNVFTPRKASQRRCMSEWDLSEIQPHSKLSHQSLAHHGSRIAVFPAWSEHPSTAVSQPQIHQSVTDILSGSKPTEAVTRADSACEKTHSKLINRNVNLETEGPQMMKAGPVFSSVQRRSVEEELPVTTTDSGMGSMPVSWECRRSSEVGPRSSVDDHSEASTLDGVANLPTERQATTVLVNKHHNAPDLDLQRQSQVAEHQHITGETCRIASGSPEIESVAVSDGETQQKFTVHRDSAFTKVLVSGAELDEIRKNISLSSSAGGSLPNSHNNSSSEAPIKLTTAVQSPSCESPNQSSFLPITAFPNTAGNHNVGITKPSAVSLIAADKTPPREPLLPSPILPATETLSPMASPEPSPEPDLSFSSKTENVNRTLEKQLEKLKEQLDAFGDSPALSPSAEQEISSTECDEVALPVYGEGVASVKAMEDPLSPMEDLQAMERAQNLLVISHEEQLAQTTTMCKQEMRLLVDLRDGNKDFDLYLADLQDLVSAKLRSVAILRTQIREYTNILAD